MSHFLDPLRSRPQLVPFSRSFQWWIGLGRGAQGHAPGQNFFIFLHFSEKIGQIVGWRPLCEILDPPLHLHDSILERGKGNHGTPPQPSSPLEENGLRNQLKKFYLSWYFRQSEAAEIHIRTQTHIVNFKTP